MPTNIDLVATQPTNASGAPTLFRQAMPNILFPPGAVVGQARWWKPAGSYAAVVVDTIVPMAALFFRTPPEASTSSAASARGRASGPVLGLPPNLVLGLLALAIFCCCVTMAMPLSHMVAFCSDIGIGPAHGATVRHRQMWGWLAGRQSGWAARHLVRRCQHGGGGSRIEKL